MEFAGALLLEVHETRDGIIQPEGRTENIETKEERRTYLTGLGRPHTGMRQDM
jgi:hypothetical protein